MKRFLVFDSSSSSAGAPPRSGRSHPVRPVVATVMVFAAVAAALAVDVPYDYHVKCTPENAIFGHFSPAKKPVITIKSGEVVRIDGGGGNKWGNNEDPDTWLKKNNIPLTVESSPVLTEVMRAMKETPRPEGITGGHFLIGPVYIEDAEPGDSLEVRVLQIYPRLPYGANAARPGGGGLPDLVPRPWSRVYLIDTGRNVAVVDKDLEIPLMPFNGVMGTCPPDSEGPLRRSGPPGAFGGNLDCRELTTGSTLYVPVFQKGALFYTGDCHAAQGDGEIAGDAIGTANTCVLKFILHKGKTMKGPRAETPTHYLTFGLDPDLDKAMRLAMIDTIDFFGEKLGYNFMEGLTVTSAAVSFRVTQVVDKTLGVHGMIPKKLFVSQPDTYWYRPL